MKITAKGLTDMQAKALVYFALSQREFENVRHESNKWTGSRYTEDSSYRSTFCHPQINGRDLTIYVNMHRFRLSNGARNVHPHREIRATVDRKELTTESGHEFTYIEVSIDY